MTINPDNCKLMPQNDTAVVETEIATLWIEEGILYSASKKGKRTMANIRQYAETLKRLIGNRKVYMITETNNIEAYAREQKEYLFGELLSCIKGVAVISCKPFQNVVDHCHPERSLGPAGRNV